MRRLAALIAAIYATSPAIVYAQVTTAPTPTPVTPINLMPPGKVYVDVTKFPKNARKGYTDRKLVFSGCDTGIANAPNNSAPAGTQPYSGTYFSGCTNANGTNWDTSGSGAGAFRIFCSFVKVAFDDPIVHPGQAGTTHGHQFFGNDTTDFRTNVNKMDEIGGSSCGGGLFNRTGYWSPFFVDTLDGTPIFTIVANFYYKTFDYSIPVTQWPTKGLRIIAGNPNATDVDPTNAANYFECWNQNTGSNVNNGQGNPTINSNVPTAASAVTLSGTSLTINSGNSSTYDGKILETTSSSAVTITLSAGASLPNKFQIRQKGAGVVTVNAGGGVTFSAQHGSTTQYGVESVLLFNTVATDAYTVYTELPYRFDHIPSTAQAAALKLALGGSSDRTCNIVKMNEVLPQCMKGTDILDSPDHASHMAYMNPANSPACPVGFRAATIPAIEGLFHFIVLPANLDRIRLSSDWSKQGAIDANLPCATAEKNYCAGVTGHMDWVNGWDQTTLVHSTGLSITQLIIRDCYPHTGPTTPPRQEGRNCSDQVIGDVDGDGKHWILGF